MICYCISFSEVKHLLNSIERSLKNYPTIPIPPSKYLDGCKNKLVLVETSYCEKEMTEEHLRLVKHLNTEQKRVYNNVLNSVENNDGGFSLCMVVEVAERHISGKLSLLN